MIKATFTEKGNRLSLRIEGHAGYAEEGKDIVCSSATILAYTVAQFVLKAENEGYLASPAEIKLYSGDTIITCEPFEEMYPLLKEVYSFAQMGYAILEYNYPQYVAVEMFGEA